MSGRLPYVRPMRGWWLRNAYFRRYMWREASAVAVAAYAVVLTVGLWRLNQGEAAWNEWLQAMRSPLSLLGHALILVAMIVHAKSWFEIMPKTLPTLRVGGRRIAATAITRTGWLAAGLTSILVLSIAWLAARLG